VKLKKAPVDPMFILVPKANKISNCFSKQSAIEAMAFTMKFRKIDLHPPAALKLK
jgi:hypothetical protein